MSARARYAESMFESRVFTPTSPTVRKPPAGRRRDQTTAELMGHYDDKALRAEPKKTFVPRELTETAHDRKLNFLSSDILPRADTTPNPVVDPVDAELGYMSLGALPCVGIYTM